jgi:hypothetical protein
MDPDYDQFPAEELAQMLPLDPAEGRVLWKELVSAIYDHPLKIPASADTEILATFMIDWDHPNEGRDLLQRHLGILGDPTVLVFWGPSTALRCPWSLFLKHWDDFFYPSDDNSVLVVPSAGLRLFTSTNTA